MSSYRLGAGAIALVFTMAAVAHAQRTVSGTVRDSATGRPLAGAVIELRRDDVRRTGQSDDGGFFRITLVPPGPYTYHMRRLGFGSRTGTIDVAGNDLEMTIAMMPIARDLDTLYVRGGVTAIYGVVGTSEDLRPLPGAKIHVMGTNRVHAADSAGSFFVPLRQSGVYMVRITMPGYEHRLFPVAVTSGRAVDASRLLDSTTNFTPGLEALWKDLEQRQNLRSLNSALVPASEIRQSGGELMDALANSPSFVARGLIVGHTMCVFVNGTPRPGLPLDAIPVEDIEVVELYGEKDDAVLKNLAYKWPARAACGGANRLQRRYEAPDGPRAKATAKFAVVWLKP